MTINRTEHSARRIVVLGGGFGGAYCARALEKCLGRFDLDICLIDRNNYFVFYPLLIEAGTGSIEPRHAVIPIWAAGVAPNPLIRNLGLPLDKLGYILCERDLRVRGFQNVWAIGDCALNPGPDGKPYPATAQHALRQGEDLARNISDVFRGRIARPCDISTRGSM